MRPFQWLLIMSYALFGATCITLLAAELTHPINGLIVSSFQPEYEVPHSWYVRVDHKASDASSVRCLCDGITKGRDMGKQTFIVTSSQNYPDAVGRLFSWEKRLPHSPFPN